MAPRSIIFPVDRIDRNSLRLQVELRGIYRRYRRGLITALEAYRHGFAAIQRNSQNMRLDFEAYVTALGLQFNGDFTLLQEAEAEAQDRWRRIIADYTASVETASYEPGCCSCTEHHSLKAKAPNYWQSRQGIIRRMDGLAQDLNFRTVNNAVRVIAPTNGVQWLRWVTAGDDRVCPDCIAASMGGRSGYYQVNWFMPAMPLHPGDRCQWEIIMFNPFPEAPR